MSGSGYIAANGQAITEEMIGRWCEAYDRGEFPEGERTVGGVVHGRPPLSAEGSAVLSVKVAPAMKRRIEGNAREAGVSTSEYVRGVLAAALVSA